ncbi:MAG: hypothetical protein KME55_22930 [Nostoc indistinguendum CM1-VF10]|nr:hypothetical protein [Nostoc indistinguendum CM1-VF10]
MMRSKWHSAGCPEPNLVSAELSDRANTELEPVVRPSITTESCRQTIRNLS